jgi:hypothetical protein
VLPIQLFPLFTASEAEALVSGSSTVDVAQLRECTEYEGGLTADDPLIRSFWRVLEGFNTNERTSFLRFVWARSRMPSSAQDLPMNFKIQIMHSAGADGNPDEFLPHAQTCFFSLSLPRYSSEDILRTKLLYAIHNSPNMDADVRMHTAEGWAE